MITSAGKRALRAETKRCREGGRPCRFCATLRYQGPHRAPVVPRWEQIAIDWERAFPEIPSWRDTVSAWQP